MIMWEVSWLPFAGARTVMCCYCERKFNGLARSVRLFGHYLLSECADVMGEAE